MQTSLVRRGLSGNALKIIAAVAMLIDHAGLLLFPRYIIFRVIGRLAFPIFAFMIAEGARHTRNRLRYFLTVLGVGLAIQAVYYFAMHDTELSIFMTFSFSIPLIYLLDGVKREIFRATPSPVRIFAWITAFMIATVGVYFACRNLKVDYGFFGVMTPVATSLFMLPDGVGEALRRFDCLPMHVATCGASLFMLSGSGLSVQSYALLALPLLLLYSGKRGKWKLKYFFYVFYPAHLVLLWGIRLLWEMIK